MTRLTRRGVPKFAPGPRIGAGWDAFYSGLLAARDLSTQSGEPLPDRLRWAKFLIDSNYADALDLDRMAREVHVSRFHFARAFRQTFGEPPHRYLQRRRLRAAESLLETTDLPITEICLEVGFSSLGSFSRLFRDRFEMSPSQYRHRFRRVSVAVGLDLGCDPESDGSLTPSGPLELTHPTPPRPIPCCFLSVYSGLRFSSSRQLGKIGEAPDPATH